MFSCECGVVFVLHVCLDCSCLLVHSESARKIGACVPNVAVFLKSTIFRGAVKLVQNVGTNLTAKSNVLVERGFLTPRMMRC